MPTTRAGGAGGTDRASVVVVAAAAATAAVAAAAVVAVVVVRGVRAKKGRGRPKPTGRSVGNEEGKQLREGATGSGRMERKRTEGGTASVQAHKNFANSL